MDILMPHVADIAPEGLDLSGKVTADDLALSKTDSVLRGPLGVTLHLDKLDGTIHLTGLLDGTVVRQCVRCLEEYDDQLSLTISADYVQEAEPGPRGRKRAEPGKKAAADMEEALEAEGEEAYQYQGDQLSLAPMLREQIILAAPMHPLCREACLGLCPQCGKDLNQGPCQCAAEPVNSPFRVLRSDKRKTGGQTGP